MGDSSYLVDSNVLLRISKREDPKYVEVRAALRVLRARGARLCFTSQNLAEFWNVCTRPAQQNGFGLSIRSSNSADVMVAEA